MKEGNVLVSMKTVISLIISILCVNMATSQIKVEKNMLELSPNLILAEELKNLMEKERGRDYYKTSLIWKVWNTGLIDAKQGCELIITMQDDVSLDYEYAGFFYLDETLVVVSGALESRLFTPLDYKKVKVKKAKKITNKLVWEDLIAPSDYSTWIYFFKYDDLSLHMLEEYTLP